MILPNREEFLESINCINDTHVKEKLLMMYDKLKGLSDADIDLYKTIKEVMEAIFNPYGISKDTAIPLSFFDTALGAFIITVLNEKRERYYLINDIIEMSKTEKRPKGYTRQYIKQEIDAGRLKATKENGRWIIAANEAIRFIKGKNAKE